MPKNREKTRDNRHREQALDRHNGYGFMDPTPYEAVERIRRGQRAAKRDRKEDASNR